jgi:hypothetical protein
MQSVQFQTEIGPDGFLNLSVRIGQEEAKTPVKVTIEPLSDDAAVSGMNDDQWHEFIEQTYGSCANLGLEEPEDLPPPSVLL